MRIHAGELKKRGWSAAEIEHARVSLQQAEQQKHPYLAMLERSVFWLLLAITVAGIFVVSLEITPALLWFKSSIVAFILILLGLCLGTLYSLLLHDIEWLQGRHHAIGISLLGSIGVMNIFFITSVMNRVQGAINFGEQHSPLLLGSCFALALLLPYLFHVLHEQPSFNKFLHKVGW